MVSFNYLRQVKEPVSLKNEGIEVTRIKRFSRAKKKFKENKNFRNFVIGDAMYLISITIFAFYAVYGIKKFNLPTSYVGNFTIVLMGSMVLCNIIFGYLGDSFGHKSNLIMLSISSMAASIIAVTSNNILIYGLVFVFMGCATAIQGISRLAFVVEVCNESERSFYISLLNTVTSPALFFGLISGIVISIAGFGLVFLMNALLAGGAAIWLYKNVEEPRKIRTP
jgi:MFS family permease